ncbi:type IV pilus assembly protein PilM [Candidatus Palauibacter sp.]|uniref:type IV pilus assembly protein PilM n=1 Tax=Candidatus Palauibacter sp. TaxID=3101350 RepID=UPI003B0267B2
MLRKAGDGAAPGGRGVRTALRVRRREITVGLDIGRAFSKAAVIDHAGAAPRVVRIAVTPNAPDADAGVAPDSALVADAVASMFERERISADDVVIGLGGRDVVSKRIEVARMAEAEARAVLPWEAEQHVPFDMESVQLDFAIADPDGDDQRMSVLLAAAKLELIESRVALLRRAGLRPAAIDVEAFALYNAFEANHPEAMVGVTALVDIGVATTTVNVLDDGLPVLARDLRFGTATLLRELARDRGLTAERAASALRGETRNPETSDLADFLADRADPVVDGIERSAKLLETEDSGLGIARVYLCGGGAGVPGLPEIIAHRLGVETHVANAIARLEAGPDVADDPALQDASPMLMLAVGLALRRPAAARPPRNRKTT